jgi:hypothetical protein
LGFFMRDCMRSAGIYGAMTPALPARMLPKELFSEINTLSL